MQSRRGGGIRGLVRQGENESDLAAYMAGPECGQKRSCRGCGTRFHDFNRTPPRCPKCDLAFEGVTGRPEDRRRRIVMHGPVIERIASMSMEQLRKRWLESMKTLSSERKRVDWKDASLELDAIPEEWFRRPSTYAEPGRGGTMGDPETWAELGVLGFLEYRAGLTEGRPMKARRRTLDRVFENELPPVFAESCLAERGRPASPPRLKKMAGFLAAHARNFTRNDPVRYGVAIKSWKDDLNYLHERHCRDRFRFDWPPDDLD